MLANRRSRCWIADTGELEEKTLEHEGETVREFYSALSGSILVGIEATGSMQWFVELMEELGIECRVGHPAKIRKAETRKQKHNRRDARLLLTLIAENRFPTIWMPSTEQRDLRTLLRHRSSVGAHAIASPAHPAIDGTQPWPQARPLPMESSGPGRTPGVASSSSRQRATESTDDFVSSPAGIESLRGGDQQHPQARRLLTHPGVGPITALATEVFLGDPKRFIDGKALASYIGMIPSEHSSGRRQRLGAMSKQGNTLLRYLWCEAAMHAVERDPELKRFYRRKLVQKGLGKARVAAARKLGIRLWIMMRDQIDYQEFCRRGKRGRKAVVSVRGCLIATVVLRQQ